MSKKREKTKNNGLNKRFFSKIKQEFHDIDYAHKLNEEEKAWLSKFMNEDLGANFTDKGEPIYKTQEQKRESYQRNNKRNVDIYSTAKATGRLIYEELPLMLTEEFHDPTDDIIEKIDSERED